MTGQHQGFSYLSKVGARGLLNLGEKSFLDHQNWENLMQSKRTGPQLQIDYKPWIEEISCFNCLHKNSKENLYKNLNEKMFYVIHIFYANFHESVTLLFLFEFSRNFHQNEELRNWE